MRPILLTMQAFGPYKDEVVIDFSKFNQGLFLISGLTGSGKSSVFDALCYALYNEASGDYKDPKMFRSDFASDELITYVKLSFTHQNKTYEVYRKPSYYQKKKKSDEYTLKSSEAELLIDGKLSYTGTSEVTKAIEEILRVKASQFKQIVMIAQGEFLKLLLTKSDERMGIYRRLFNTQHYDEFSNILKEKFSTIEKEYKQVNTEFEVLKQDINIGYDHEDMDTYNEVLQSKINELLNIQDIKKREYQALFDKLNELNIQKSNLLNIIKVKSDLAKIDEELTSSTLKSKEIEANRELLKILKLIKTDYLPLISELNKVNDQTIINNRSIEKEAKQLEEYKLKLSDVIKIELDLKDKKKTYIKEKATLDKVKEQLTIYRQLNDFISSLADKTATSKKYQEEISELTHTIDKNNATIKALQLSIDNSSHLIADKASVEHGLEEINKDIVNHYRLNELSLMLSKQRKESETIIKEYDIKTKEYQAYELEFYANQAGILASTLKDKEACPVCGSFDHPSIAKLSNKEVSKNTLDKLYQEKETIRNKLEKSNNKANNYLQEIELIKKTLKHQDIKELNELKTDYLERQILINKQLANIANNKELLNTLNNDLTVKIDRLKTTQKIYDDLKKDILVIKTKQEELNKQLVIEDELTAKRQMILFETNIKNYEKEFNNIQINKTSLNELIQTSTGSLSAKNELKSSLIKQTKNIEADLSAKGYSNDKYRGYLSMVKDISTIEITINDYDKKLYELNIQAKELKNTIKKAPTITLDAIKEKIEETSKLMQELDSEKELNQIDIALKQKAYQKIDTLNRSQGKLNKLYAIYKPLSDTANANLAKKQRINFEIFVQGLYFNQVLEAANKRLHKMTLNRFTLMIKENNDYKSISGLDIEVVDEWTMKKRDVKTLSGGESFKASLALALGLSDIIEAKAAGVELECIFIDEGFGTLDQESLNQALLLLQELVNQNRLVGIISHVEELKQQIDQKIEVNKDYKGSTIRQVL